MILQDTPFQFFTFWSAVESGLYYAILGFYVLIFFYFLLMRFRTSKKMYWLFFSFLFLFLAAGRVCFIIYYFYAPELTTLSQVELVNILMVYYRLATLFTWFGIACLMVMLGILIFPPLTESSESKSEPSIKNQLKTFFRTKYVRLILKIALFVIPIVIGVAALILPDSLFMDPDFVDKYPLAVNSSSLITFFGYPAGRAVLNFIILPIFVAFIPFLYLSLAMRTFGVLRRSYALNAVGFLIYFLGRILQGVLGSFPHVSAILPPLLILLSLLIIVIANNYEQLK